MSYGEKSSHIEMGKYEGNRRGMEADDMKGAPSRKHGNIEGQVSGSRVIKTSVQLGGRKMDSFCYSGSKGKGVIRQNSKV